MKTSCVENPMIPNGKGEIVPLFPPRITEDSGKQKHQPSYTVSYTEVTPCTLGVKTLDSKKSKTSNRFTYRARPWTLVKSGRSWKLRAMFRGQRINHSCGETELKAALITAKLKIDALLDGNKEAARALMQRTTIKQWPTIAELETAFNKLPLKEPYRRACVNCLRSLLRQTNDGDPAKLSAAVLNQKTAHSWFRLARERAVTMPQHEAARHHRTAASIFNQAKAVISDRAIQDMRHDGLDLPDFSGFVKYKRPRAIAQPYLAPDAELIRATLHAWLKLPRNEFIAAGIELSCGLRKSAIAALTWKQLAEAVRITITAEAKNQTGHLRLRPIDPFWTVLQRTIARHHWQGADHEHLIAGTATERGEDVFRRISAWLRGLGWKTQKTNHALRAYAGGLVIAKFGIYQGSKWLHHQSIAVTEKHYSYFVDELQARPQRINLRWAKV